MEERLSVLELYMRFWKNSFNYKGRDTRRQYWGMIALNFLISIGVALCAGFFVAIFGSFMNELFYGIISLYSIAIFFPIIAMTARRLHDVNRSGFWLLLLLTVIGSVVIFVFTLLPTAANDNKWGKSRAKQEADNEVHGAV